MRLIFMVAFIICLAAGPAVAGPDQSLIEKLRATPAPFNRGTGLEIEPIISSDANPQDYEFEYRWFVNGEENLFESSSSFPGEELQRGDTVSIRVTPVALNGERLQPFFSKQQIVDNAPPAITSTLPTQLANKVFTYQVEANDPDDDPLIFSLQDASQEMFINSQSGELICNLEQHVEATSFSVVIVVEDAFGGRAEQRFKLDLSFVEQKEGRNE